MFYVYVLRSEKDHKLYIGSTSNLRRRLEEHKHGKSTATNPRRPLSLPYYEAYIAEEDARNRESALKRRGQARKHLMNRLEKSLRQAQS